MKPECIYTLANASVRLQLLAMERSLRAVGCDLPLRVIPYNDDTFELPENASWWKTPLHQWMLNKGANRLTAKNQCLTLANYIFIDTDVIFLRNPLDVLEPLQGFVVADTELTKPQWTYNADSAAILAEHSSTWLCKVFNGGFFASDRALYSEQNLREILENRPEYHRAFIEAIHDQPGLNLMVAISGAPYTNLTLPPHNMESTWAGDYPGNYESLWQDPARKPIFMHWAGPVLDEERPINELYYNYLTSDEKKEWEQLQATKKQKRHQEGRWPVGARILNAVTHLLYPGFYVQPRP